MKNLNVIDVCFVVYGSLYYVFECMRVFFKNSWDVLVKVMKIFKVDIFFVGVDECLNEFCMLSGCINVLFVNGDVEVIFVKKIVFVLIIVVVVVKCDDCNE